MGGPPPAPPGLKTSSASFGIPGIMPPGMGGSGGGETTVSANNNVKIDSKLDSKVVVNFDELADEMNEANEWFELLADTDMLKVISDDEIKQEQLKISKKALDENRKNNKIMISIATAGLLLTYLNTKKGGKK